MRPLKLILVLSAVTALLVTNGFGQTLDEIIVDSTESSHEFQYHYDEPNQMVKLEYDILLSYDEYSAMEAHLENLTRRKKRAIGIKHSRWDPSRWPGNRVDYQYGNDFSNDDTLVVESAIQTWSRYTCLSFHENRYALNRIKFDRGNGCWSRIGMVGGAQSISLTAGCMVEHIVIHEIGHALGLYHEQARPDRDDYVTIHYENISPHQSHNFQRFPWRTFEYSGIPYDYRSLMHYGKTAFSPRRLTTISTIDPEYSDIIGNAKTLSFLDIKTVNLLYNCKRHTRGCTLDDSDCPGDGFVGKDCTCWCRGDNNDRVDAVPVTHCDGSGGVTARPATARPATARPATARPATARPRFTRRPITRRPTRPTACSDSHRQCSDWARVGECQNNAPYMNAYCKRSCRVCTEGGDRRAVVTPRPTCVDTGFHCRRWSRMGYCHVDRYMATVRRLCRKTCGICQPAPTTRRPIDPDCRDTSTMCSLWSRRGYCATNRRYMLTACRQSCTDCYNPDQGPHNQDGGFNNDEEGAQIHDMNVYSQSGTSHESGSIAVYPLQQEPTTTCTDQNTQCPQWAADGQCERVPGYMVRICAASCGLSC